jgi:uncharacterized protein (TIGR02453 family)
MEEILEFLKELEINNNKDWFEANRKRYEKTRKEFIAFTEKLILEIRKFDDDLPLLNPKECIFRIFRDVRFSLDKSPYKTNYGTYLAKGGFRAGFAGYYFHISPSECFQSGGVYMPTPEHLQAVRQEIYYHPEEYLTIINNKAFKKIYTDAYFDSLKNPPKGFPKDWEYIDLLKPRNFAFGHQIDPKEITSPDLLDNLVERYKVIYPLNHFINSAIEESLNP